jgi:hypothetical protein
MIEYTNVFMNYNKSQFITADCNEIIFLNDSGSLTARINNSYLISPNPGQTEHRLILTGNYGEIDRTQYAIAWPTGNEPFMRVVRKIYKKS